MDKPKTVLSKVELYLPRHEEDNLLETIIIIFWNGRHYDLVLDIG